MQQRNELLLAIRFCFIYWADCHIWEPARISRTKCAKSILYISDFSSIYTAAPLLNYDFPTFSHNLQRFGRDIWRTYKSHIIKNQCISKPLQWYHRQTKDWMCVSLAPVRKWRPSLETLLVRLLGDIDESTGGRGWEGWERCEEQVKIHTGPSLHGPVTKFCVPLRSSERKVKARVSRR
jgi:hypothetical protein